MPGFAEKRKKALENATKQAIYDAAVSVIKDAGFKNLKIQDIADRAGIATGTMYNYFRSKQDLLDYIDNRLHEMLLETARQIAAEHLPADRKLRKLNDRIIQLCAENDIVFDAAEKYGAKRLADQQEMEAKYEDGVAILRDVIKQGIAENIFRRVNPESAARMYFLMTLGIVESQKFWPAAALEKYKKAQRTFVVRYLKKPENKNKRTL